MGSQLLLLSDGTLVRIDIDWHCVQVERHCTCGPRRRQRVVLSLSVCLSHALQKAMSLHTNVGGFKPIDLQWSPDGTALILVDRKCYCCCYLLYEDEEQEEVAV